MLYNVILDPYRFNSVIALGSAVNRGKYCFIWAMSCRCGLCTSLDPTGGLWGFLIIIIYVTQQTCVLFYDCLVAIFMRQLFIRKIRSAD